MNSMSTKQRLGLFAIQISADSHAVWSSETCHARSRGSRPDVAHFATRILDSIVTFEIVTPERVIPLPPALAPAPCPAALVRPMPVKMKKVGGMKKILLFGTTVTRTTIASGPYNIKFNIFFPYPSPEPRAPAEPRPRVVVRWPLAGLDSCSHLVLVNL